MAKILQFLLLTLFWGTTAFCQIGQMQTPQPTGFQPVLNTPQQNNQYGGAVNGMPGNKMSSVPNGNQQRKEMEELQRDIAELNGATPKVPTNEQPYYDAFAELNKMAANANVFSITEATYIVENAYYNNKYPKANYYNSIKVRAELCKQILKREHLPSTNLAINYVIQKLYQQDNKYYDAATKQTITVPRLKYDFDDWHGDTSYSQMFVSKVFTSGKGQCHSLPRLYLMLAEQLGAKAYLSNAPEHNFIRFTDTAGHLYNFETTSGVLVTDKFMMQSSFINATAIKNKIYLDTLSQKQLLALCYNDLALEYVSKYGYNAFVEQLVTKALQLYPNGVQSNIMLGIIDGVKLSYYADKHGHPKEADLPKFPDLYPLYQAMHKQYDFIDALGYQEMPKEAYNEWLRSVAQEKNKQEAQEMEQQVKYQLQYSRVKIIPQNKN